MYLIFLISVLLAGVVTHIINSLFGDRETMQINWAGLVFMSFFSLIGYIFSKFNLILFITDLASRSSSRRLWQGIIRQR